MRVTILAYGSRGDVQPYLALGLGLACAGHTVRLAAPEMFRALVQETAPALEFAPLAGDPTHLMRAAANPSPLMAALPGSVRMAFTVVGYAAPLAARLISDARAACQGADLIIHTLLTIIIGHQIALEQGSADLAALVFPVFTPTVVFPNPLFKPWPTWTTRLGQHAASIGPRYNYFTHREFSRVFWLGNRFAIDLLRRRNPHLIGALKEWPLGQLEVLPEETWPARPTPILYGISRHALGCPQDWSAVPGQDQGPNDSAGSCANGSPGSLADGCSRLTGYWFLDTPRWQPPEELLRFLDSGPPPIAVSFGSLIPRDARWLVGLAMDALKQTGQRGLFLSGWSGLSGSTVQGRALFVRDAPYDWLFPRLAAAVHHGGMGTTAAALRAGIPSVAIPFTFDQPFWGRQIHTLGAGPRPIPPTRLTAHRLAQAIQEMINNPDMRQQTALLGEKIRAEDGVTNAVAWIEKYMGK